MRITADYPQNYKFYGAKVRCFFELSKFMGIKKAPTLGGSTFCLPLNQYYEKQMMPSSRRGISLSDIVQ